MQSNTDEGAAHAPGPSPRGRWRLRLVAGLAALAVCAAGIAVFVAVRGPAEAGDELDAHDGAYGYDASMAVGHIFTDGLTHIQVSSKVRGPLRLISAGPIEESGDTVRVIGTLARIVPDMLPPGYETDGSRNCRAFHRLNATPEARSPSTGSRFACRHLARTSRSNSRSGMRSWRRAGTPEAASNSSTNMRAASTRPSSPAG